MYGDRLHECTYHVSCVNTTTPATTTTNNNDNNIQMNTKKTDFKKIPSLLPSPQVQSLS